MQNTLRLPLGLLALGICSRLLAQSTFDDSAPALNGNSLSSLSAGYSYSGKAELDHGTKVGGVQVDHYDFNYTGRLPGPAGLGFFGGVFWSEDDLNLTGPVPLPRRLQSKGVNLGLVKKLTPDWSLLAAAKLGFAGDSSKASGSTFNVSGAVVATQKVSPAFSWDFGVGASLRDRYGVLPIVGLRWVLAPDWTLSVGFPRTALVYKASDQLSLDAGLRFQGGGYRISSTPAPGLGKTYLDYHEFRLGAGLDYRPAPNVSLVLDGGVALDRRFDYYNRNYTLKGKAAGYFRLRATLRF
jgi:Domain of unknown function (DUF6268)